MKNLLFSSVLYDNDYVPVHYSHISSDILDLREKHTRHTQHTLPRRDPTRHKQTLPFRCSTPAPTPTRLVLGIPA